MPQRLGEAFEGSQVLADCVLLGRKEAEPVIYPRLGATFHKLRAIGVLGFADKVGEGDG